MSNETMLQVQITYPGFNVLLMGPPGTGKTFSIKTLIDTGLEVFYLALEPGVETILGAYADKNQPIPKNFHWHYIKNKGTSFADLIKLSENVATLDQKMLASVVDNKRSINNPLTQVLKVLQNFTSHRGVEFGPVDSWGNDKLLVIDSLTALTTIINQTVVGTKPIKSIADWGLIQANLTQLINNLTLNCVCNFVLIAHVEREIDAVLGGIKLVPSTPGKALTGVIGNYFSDVILTQREGTNFYWDTASLNADTKARNLPIALKQSASFGPIVKTWEKRKSVSLT